jgi:purine-binding chemotaxis protein CheW
MEGTSVNETNRLLVFTIEDRSYALHLEAVERVVRAVEVTPLPKAPPIVLGIINVRGRITPVVDMRKRFGLPEREIGLNDQLIIARTPKLHVSLVADSVDGVMEIDGEEIIRTDLVLPKTEYVEGVVKLDDGLLLIHDLDRFLSLSEEEALLGALQERGQPS